MAWNEPGGSGKDKDKDPWNNRNKDQGPPDLDEVVRKMQQKIGGIFGKKGKNGGGGGSSPNFSSSMVVGIGAVVALIWLVSGFYIVDAAERGIILRFGNFHATTTPGLHWRIPYPVDQVYYVNIEEIKTVSLGLLETSSGLHESLMLTKDENIVDIQIAAQYRINDARKFLFMVRDPDNTLKQAVESALRELVGKSKMDFVLTDGRAEIQDKVSKLTQDILERYDTGLMITSINIQNAQPPKQVQASFADAVKAREDKQRSINDAETYRNEVLPKARGHAARQMEEAQGYKQRVIAESQGETKRFVSVLQQYKKAPRVTRERMYLETIEEVMAKTSKVFIDVKEGGNNMIYLPLDRLLQERRIEVTPDMMIPTNRSDSSDNLSPSSQSLGSSDGMRTRRDRQ